ncbi:hypothetical protein LguiA_034765 [Lonicera macranthoides]
MQVKIMKCFVDWILVDTSFNQMAGLGHKALNLGNRKLQEVLMVPAESMDEELSALDALSIRIWAEKRPDEQFHFLGLW